MVFLLKDIHGDHHWKLALKRHRLHVGEAPWTMYKKEFSEFTVSTCMTSKNVPVKLQILIDLLFYLLSRVLHLCLGVAKFRFCFYELASLRPSLLFEDETAIKSSLFVRSRSPLIKIELPRLRQNNYQFTTTFSQNSRWKCHKHSLNPCILKWNYTYIAFKNLLWLKILHKSYIDLCSATLISSEFLAKINDIPFCSLIFG